tara:strand:+ start:6601 stop:7158 length:558 start_codon:yes stop_codon:yes gene_type:complete
MEFSDIKPTEVVKVLVESDGVEEDMFAKVLKNENDCLSVTYLSPTSKIYKGACVYQFDAFASRVEFQSLMEHHAGVNTIEDIGWRRVGDGNAWVDELEVDDSVTVSDVEDMSDDEESDLSSSMDDFIAPDDPNDLTPPPDHVEVDRLWNDWSPPSSGGRRFKGTVDRIEESVRTHLDDAKFDKGQ